MLKALRIGSQVILSFIIISSLALGSITIQEATNLANAVAKVEDSTGGGSGYFLKYKSKSYFITAGHVCGKDKMMVVTQLNGVKSTVKVISSSSYPDICVLESPKPGMVTLSDHLHCNLMGVKVGYPNLGRISAVKESLCGTVFFGVAIPGESGGPIYDMDKNVAGMTIGYFFVRKDLVYTYVLDSISIANYLDKLPK